MKVLLSDSDPHTLQILKREIHDLGHEVVVLTERKEDETYSVQNLTPFDLLICDEEHLETRGKRHTQADSTFHRIVLASRPNQPNQDGKNGANHDRILAALRSDAFGVLFKPVEPVELKIQLHLAARIVNLKRSLAAQSSQLTYLSKLSALGQLAGGIAHEINNPLTIISGSSQQIGDLLSAAEDSTSSPLGQSQEFTATRTSVLKAVERIDRNVTRISQIIQEMLYFGGSSPTVQNLKSIPLSQLFKSILVFCKERFRFHQIEMKFTGLPDDQEVVCRPAYLAQIFLCLLNNAQEAAQLASKGDRWVEILFQDLESQFQLTVTNSGPKIDPKIHERIFEPFFSTKEQKQSAGIGLSTAREMILEDEGTLKLDIQSENTRFVLTLPKLSSSSQKQEG